MKIYIASPYIRQKDVNVVLYKKLSDMGHSVFLPETIDLDAITEDEMKYVAQLCYREIENCDLMVIVHPFGMSVASEVGYAICLKKNGYEKDLVLYTLKGYNKSILHSEAMIMPYIDLETESMDEIIKFVNSKQMHIA